MRTYNNAYLQIRIIVNTHYCDPDRWLSHTVKSELSFYSHYKFTLSIIFPWNLKYGKSWTFLVYFLILRETKTFSFL